MNKRFLRGKKKGERCEKRVESIVRNIEEITEIHHLESVIRSVEDRIKSIAAKSLKPGADRVIHNLDMLDAIWELPGDRLISYANGKKTGFFHEIERYLGRKVDHMFGIGRVARMKEGFGVRLRLGCGRDGCRRSVAVFARPGLHTGAFAYVYDTDGNYLANLRDEYVLCVSCRDGAAVSQADSVDEG